MNDRLYTFTRRIRCLSPKCRSADVITYKSLRRELDGSRTRYAKCRTCGWKFFIVEEDIQDFPTVGKTHHHPPENAPR